MWDWLNNSLSLFGLFDYFKRFLNWLLEKIGIKRKKSIPKKQPITTTVIPEPRIEVKIESSPNSRVEIFVERPKKEEALNLHRKESVWIIKEDQIEPYKSRILIDEKFEKIKNKLKHFLSNSDFSILTSSIAILNHEEKNPKYSRFLYLEMLKRYDRERGKRIFKRLRDSSFEKILIPFVGDLERLNPIESKEAFSKFFESFLNETADRIWVKFPFTPNVIYQISEKMKKYKRISVYYAGEEFKIEAVDKACREFISQNKDYSLSVLESTYLGIKGKIWIISKL